MLHNADNVLAQDMQFPRLAFFFFFRIESVAIPLSRSLTHVGSSLWSSYFHRTLSKFQPLLSNRLNLKEMALGKDHVLTMNDGNKIPVLGFGTYSADPVSKILAVNYMHC